MDTQRRQVLEAELTDAVRERERLDVVIAYLSDRLGIAPPTTGAGAKPEALRVDSMGRVDPESLVSEGEFFGSSATAAAARVLEKVGRPNNLKTEELMRAIRKGGVPVKNASTLYRSLIRYSKVQRVGPGLWGLAAWFPSTGPKRSHRDHGESLTATTADEADAATEAEQPDEGVA